MFEKLPHFQDNIAKILFSAKDFVLDPHTMKFAFEMTEEDYNSSEHRDSDEIWLDDEEPMESEPEVSKNATRWDSGTGDTTDLSGSVGQAKTQDNQTEEDKHSPGPFPIPTNRDSQPSLVNVSPSQTPIETASTQFYPIVLCSLLIVSCHDHYTL